MLLITGLMIVVFVAPSRKDMGDRWKIQWPVTLRDQCCMCEWQYKNSSVKRVTWRIHLTFNHNAILYRRIVNSLLASIEENP